MEIKSYGFNRDLSMDRIMDQIYIKLSHNKTRILQFLKTGIHKLEFRKSTSKKAQSLGLENKHLLNLHNSPPKWIFINRMKFEIKSISLNENEIATLSQIKQKNVKQSNSKVDIHKNSSHLFSWQCFQNGITAFHLYKNLTLIEELLQDIQTNPIIEIKQKSAGTQLKLTIYFENGMKALWKPMRFRREQQTSPNQFYFSDFERHWAEIAAFHLDRILGFQRAPPVTGRLMDIPNDVQNKSTSKSLSQTIFVSPAENWCFHGKCDYYCDTTHAICGSPRLIEGSFAIYLPDSSLVRRTEWRHPWRRSYSKKKKALWESKEDYCDDVMQSPPYKSGRRLLDIIDMSVFDFLTGNLDRHHYETFTMFDNDTFILHTDQGKAFGHSNQDDLSILAPLSQCCFIRHSTLQKLMFFLKHENNLGSLMEKSLKKDPVYPVLLEPHLIALDRRVNITLKMIHKCIDTNDHIDGVVIDDGH